MNANTIAAKLEISPETEFPKSALEKALANGWGDIYCTSCMLRSSFKIGCNCAGFPIENWLWVGDTLGTVGEFPSNYFWIPSSNE